MEGLIVTICGVCPLILQKMGGLKPGFPGGLGPLPAPPVKFPEGLCPPKHPVICTHAITLILYKN